MTVKLSELKDNEMLLVGDEYLAIKEDYIAEIEGYTGLEVYTTIEYKASISARDMLENALEQEYDNMYEDWYDEICSDITDVDIEEIQTIIDRILNRNNKIAYTKDKKVEIDI